MNSTIPLVSGRNFVRSPPREGRAATEKVLEKTEGR